tara:strand:+ start:1090 stop:1407 length:318 start_codon:yes stop_codon:yes gene_type:complete
MDRNELESCMNPALAGVSDEQAPFVSLESEIPEVLFDAMKGFILANPHWDQYQVMSSALARFLYQNGSSERAVTERYLDDLFTRPVSASQKKEKTSQSIEPSRTL